MTAALPRSGELAALAKTLVFPTRGHLRSLRFEEQGRRLDVLTPDDEVFGLAREIILQRVYDDVLRDDLGLIVDAGAHVGLFTAVAAQHGRKVVSLEPKLTNFDVLRLNIHRNELDNVHPLHAALWSEDGELGFSSSWHTTGGALTGLDGEGVTVPTRSLDSLIDEHGDIDVLKLDVEGAEDEAIPASTQLHRIGSVIAELHLHRPGDERRVIDPLEHAGFDVRLIPAASLYTPAHIQTVIRNLDRLEGEWRLKAALIAFLAAPIEKPRRPAGSRDMPLVLATRHGRA